MRPTPGGKACGFLARRGLSAAPLDPIGSRIMEHMLKFLTEQTGLALILLAVLLIAAAWITFSINLRWLTIRNPARRSGKIGLSIVGALVLLLGFYLTYTSAVDGPIWKPTVTEYLSYVSLHGDREMCEAGGCKLEFFISGEYRTPSFVEAKYIDRIKTSGRIEKFRSVPPYKILNPEQYPRNPTYLEFAIDPTRPSDRIIQGQAEVTIINKLTPEAGKVATHLPYDTRKASMIVDFRALKFQIMRQLSARIETVHTDGIQRTGVIDPVRRDFANGLVVSVSGKDIPAGSSLVLVWGE